MPFPFGGHFLLRETNPVVELCLTTGQIKSRIAAAFLNLSCKEVINFSYEFMHCESPLSASMFL